MPQPKASDVIALARLTLNDRDADAYRDADDDLLEYVNDGLDHMFEVRPDLFIGAMTGASITEGHQLALNADLPVPGRYRRVLADYVIFRAEMKDDEYAVSGRAAASLKFFEGRLVG